LQKILIIQTAFIGDVILATALIEKIAAYHPDAQIDFVLRKGNERLLDNNPHVGQVYIWNKKQNKYRNLIQIIQQIRAKRYDTVINLQRFFATGLITALSKGIERIGFDKNPLSFFLTKKVKHEIGNGKHEVERNLALIADRTDNEILRPRLFPNTADFEKVKTDYQYVCLAPTSVWFTKQYPAAKWVELINKMPNGVHVHLLGGPPDRAACEAILQQANHPSIHNRAGQLSFLESAALMANAKMNYVNDSAPLHIASAMNAPVTAFFCSTVPSFGFTPLSDQSLIVETKEALACRPCGLHGKKACPEGHFKCGAMDVAVDFLHS